MASKRVLAPAKQLCNCLIPYKEASRPAKRCFTRSMATEAPLPHASQPQIRQGDQLRGVARTAALLDSTSTPLSSIAPATPSPPIQPFANPFVSTTECTLYNFPNMEPTQLIHYPSTHLLVPMRRDILHRAVVYEADGSRQGTASTKWRSEVHGSSRKVRPQKGTGRARLGDKKSPMLRGGGRAFGPKPRDFSTGLQEKVYDLAFRTALSYRYRKGELVVIDGVLDLNIGLPDGSLERYMRDVLRWNHLTGSFLVTMSERRHLSQALEDEGMRNQAQTLPVHDVEVRDLLQGKRVVIERGALHRIFQSHESDLTRELKFASRQGQLDGLGSESGLSLSVE